MRRSRDIVGLPVLDLKTGNSVGWVQDIVFDEQGHVSGIILEGGHLFHPNQGLPSNLIVAVGKDALTVSDNKVQEINGTRWSQKVGNQVYTQGGEAQGTIEDVFLDDSVVDVVGYEVSDGLFSDLIQGRGAIFQEHIMIDGKDVLIVDNQASPWDQHDEGGSLS